MNVEDLEKCKDIVQILMNYLGDGPVVAAEVIRRNWYKPNVNAELAKTALLACALKLNYVPDLDNLDYRGD